MAWDSDPDDQKFSIISPCKCAKSHVKKYQDGIAEGYEILCMEILWMDHFMFTNIAFTIQNFFTTCFKDRIPQLLIFKVYLKILQKSSP